MINIYKSLPSYLTTNHSVTFFQNPGTVGTHVWVYTKELSFNKELYKVNNTDL